MPIGGGGEGRGGEGGKGDGVGGGGGLGGDCGGAEWPATEGERGDSAN